MSLTKAAQTIQRSAYPNAYAKWEDMATALTKEITKPTLLETLVAEKTIEEKAEAATTEADAGSKTKNQILKKLPVMIAIRTIQKNHQMRVVQRHLPNGMVPY